MTTTAADNHVHGKVCNTYQVEDTPKQVGGEGSVARIRKVGMAGLFVGPVPETRGGQASV